MSERSLSRRVSRETKNKPSSFYLYLLILFGAAFLMLLLAYFVQRRNNDTALSDLRSTTAATRQELLEDIQRLEGENLALRQDQEALEAQLAELQRQKDELDAQLYDVQTSYDDLCDGYDKYVGYTSILETLYSSEVKLADGDYPGAAAELTDIDFDYFVSTIDDYDAEIEHYNPEGMFLRPRFDALVSALVKQNALDKSWAG